MSDDVKSNWICSCRLPPGGLNAFAHLLRDYYGLPAVVYLCCSWDIFRNLMVQFWAEGVQLEDYVFFFIDLFAEGFGERTPIRPWFRGDQDDDAARHAFKVRRLWGEERRWRPMKPNEGSVIYMPVCVSECEGADLPGASDSRVPSVC